MRAGIFALAILLCLTPAMSPPLALTLGIVLAITGLTAWEKQAKKYSRLIIQMCIVCLGLSIDLREVARAGLSGMAFAAGTILGTFALGAALGRMLGTETKVTTLVCSGTAICGGSAIAATGSVIKASDAQMSVSLATVFSLNAIALYVFPPIGLALGLSQQQFGTWAAVAIHDMSSVVGAGSAYGNEALATATVIKLSRVLWIVPVSILAGWMVRRSQATSGASADGSQGTPTFSLSAIIPWFIGLFLVASLVRTFVPAVTQPIVNWTWGFGPREESIHTLAELTKAASKQAMVLALMLIGSGLSKKALAAVGWRPFALGVVLWIAISVAALVVVRQTM